MGYSKAMPQTNLTLANLELLQSLEDLQKTAVQPIADEDALAVASVVPVGADAGEIITALTAGFEKGL